MKIFYIMGKSSTGKDTIFNLLISDETLKLSRLVPHTTRPARIGEKDGEDYFFYSNIEYEKLLNEGKIIESRTYQTENGEWTYFTPVMRLEDEDYITIGTLESYEKLKKVYDNNLIPIYIELDDGIRLQRALTRELTQANPKYSELCRRFLSDSEDFSEVKLETNKITTRFKNNDLETCLLRIKEYIRTYKLKRKGE